MERTADEILAHAYRIERVRVGILAHDALQVLGELAAALQGGDEPTLHRELGSIAVHRGQRRRRFRHVVIERGGSERPCPRHVLTVGVPERLKPHGALLPLARRHVASGELIRIALEGAGAKHVHVDAQLVDGILQEHAVVAEAVDVHESERIEVHLARLCGEIVLSLIERVGGHHDAFARALEVPQCRADLLQFRQTRGLEVAQIEHDELDALVALGRLDGVDHIAQQRLGCGTAGGLAECPAHGVAGELLDQFTLGGDHQGGDFRDLGNAGVQCREQKAEDDQQQDEMEDLAYALQHPPNQCEKAHQRRLGPRSTSLARRPRTTGQTFSSMRAALPDRSRR